MVWNNFLEYVRKYTSFDIEVLEHIASLGILRLYVLGLSPSTISNVYNIDIKNVEEALNKVYGSVSEFQINEDGDLSFYSIYKRTFEKEYYLYECKLLSPYYSDEYLLHMYQCCEIFYNIERKIEKFYE